MTDHDSVDRRHTTRRVPQGRVDLRTRGALEQPLITTHAASTAHFITPSITPT
jgi:hypothetical protein